MGNIRIDQELIDAATAELCTSRRSLPKQIEYWAALGMKCEKSLSQSQISGVISGELEVLVRGPYLNAIELASIVADSKNSGELERLVSTARYRYESIAEEPGIIRRIDTQTGEIEKIDAPPEYEGWIDKSDLG